MSDFKSPSENVIDLLSAIIEKAERGEVVKVAVVAVNANGDWITWYTGFHNSLEKAGALLDMAIKALGYGTAPDRIVENDDLA